MYQEKTSAQLAEIIRESDGLPLEAAKELCIRAGLAWEWETAEENWKPWVLFHAAALLRVVLRDKPAAILAAKDGPEISIQEAVSDRLWDYTFAALDERSTCHGGALQPRKVSGTVSPVLPGRHCLPVKRSKAVPFF